MAVLPEATHCGRSEGIPSPPQGSIVVGRVPGSRIVLFIAGGLLLAALVPLSQPYRHSLAWQVSAEHRPKVEQALRQGAEAFGTGPEEYRRQTRPRIKQVGNHTCISLVTYRSDGEGSFIACFDPRGSMVTERARGPVFRGMELWDYVGPWVW